MDTKIKGDGLMTGMFRDRDSADRAYTAVQLRGYSSEDIYLMMSEDTRNKHFHSGVHTTAIGNKALEGAGAGSAIGITVGAVAAAIAAAASITIPGLGILIAGPLVAAAAGAGAGGVAGGLIGAMVGAGIPKERAIVYEKGLQEGHIVIGVRPRNAADAEFIQNEWIKNGVLEIHH
jgi:hypothetical protein